MAEDVVYASAGISHRVLERRQAVAAYEVFRAAERNAAPLHLAVITRAIPLLSVPLNDCLF